MRLLVCVDESTFSHSVLPLARRLAASMNADVEIVTVVPPATRGGEPWSGQPDTAGDQQPPESVSTALATAASGFSPAAATNILIANDPAAGIVRHARATHPDIIVIATHSRGTLGELALGSTAREVTRSGVAPVLLLHPVAADGLRASDIPVGIYVFSSDGDPLGEVTELTAGDVVLRADDGTEFSLPASVTGVITAGRLLLAVSSEDVAALRKDIRA